jgi:hypothetical protein
VSRRSRRSSTLHGPRKPIPIAGRILALRQLEDGIDAYPYERTSTILRLEAYTWHVPITVPVYDRLLVLRIELDPRHVRVFVEGWTGPMKHKYADGSLCMWWPKDPPHRKWQRAEGMLKLVDTALTHLFKELYWQETGDWLGEEAPHGTPKTRLPAMIERSSSRAT